MRAEFSLKRNKILVDDPHPQSLAYLVQLMANYEFEENKVWFNFRYKYLQSQIKTWFKPWTWFKPRTLTCKYCGKTNLEEDKNKPTVSQKTQYDYLATIDHILPLSKGGKKYDHKNLCVACYPCNKNKKNKILQK